MLKEFDMFSGAYGRYLSDLLGHFFFLLIFVWRLLPIGDLFNQDFATCLNALSYCTDKYFKRSVHSNEKFGGSKIVSKVPYGSGTVVIEVLFPFHWAAILYLFYFRFHQVGTGQKIGET